VAQDYDSTGRTEHDVPPDPGDTSLSADGEEISMKLSRAVAQAIYVRNKDNLTDERLRPPEYHVRYKVWIPEVV
jgi:hypothetical protein